MSDFKKLIDELNSKLEDPYKFTLDKIISTANYNTYMIGHADSILKDKVNIPHFNDELRLKISCSITCIKLNSWINRRIWMELLTSLLNNKLERNQTKLVRLRIAVNKIEKLNNNELAFPLTQHEKTLWKWHIRQVFYTRNLVIDNYYFQNILQLPF